MEPFGKSQKFWLDRTAVLALGMIAGAALFASFDGRAQSLPLTVTHFPAAKFAVAAGAVGLVPDRPGPLLVQAIEEGRPVNVGVFGDSFGDGVWSGIYRQLTPDPNFHVYQFSKEGTGFTRYRSLNLLDDMRAKLDRQPIDVAVLSLGANDTQGIFENGHGAAYMSDEWRQIVGDRIEAMVNLLRERGVTIYWVGLPKMRDPHFDSEIAEMNSFYASKVRELDVPFIDTTALTVDRGGQYSAYLPNPVTGELTSARAGDGIHMTMTGYTFLTRGLSDRIRSSVAKVGAQLGSGRRGGGIAGMAPAVGRKA